MAVHTEKAKPDTSFSGFHFRDFQLMKPVYKWGLTKDLCCCCQLNGQVAAHGPAVVEMPY